MNNVRSAGQAVDRPLAYRPGWLWFALWTFVGVFLVRSAVDVIVDGVLSAGPGGVGFVERGLGWAMVGCTAAAVPLLVMVAVAYASSSARLEGTTLVVRQFRTRRIDLSTAAVSLTIGHALTARDAVNPKGITLPLVVLLRGVLPPDELTALAHALRPEARQGVDAQHAMTVAGALLDLATNPETRRRVGRTTRVLRVAVAVTLGIGALSLLGLGVLTLLR